LLLVLGIIGIVTSVVLVGFSLGTRNQMAEAQLELTQNQLQLASQSQIRLFEEYLRAGYLRADCSNGGLRPTADAPAHVKARYKGGRFVFSDCDPKILKTSKAGQVFDGSGSALRPPACAAQSTELTVQRSNDADERSAVLRATTTPSGKSPLLGTITPTSVRARIELPSAPVPSFGLLVNDLHCGMCHTKVNGDVVSVEAVKPFHIWGNKTWPARVEGGWYAAKSFNPTGGSSQIDIKATKGTFANYNGRKLPGKVKGGRFQPEFPKIDFSSLGSYKNPDPYVCGSRKLDTKAGNQIMIGTEKEPIKMTGDLHVTGDLVITGWYTGVGTIYVDGNVYIPFDLRAKRSIFPYDTDPAVASKKARESVRNNAHDALAVATRRNIIIGEFDYTTNPNTSVWFHEATPADKRGDKLGVRDIYKWYPGGRAEYEKLFGVAYNCQTSSVQGSRGSINLIDSYLYAQNTIGGLARKNSYSLNGGIIADNFHVVSASRYCQAGLHPVHRQEMNYSYINYDYRMLHGLPLLDRFADYFIAE
jgi:type II secretory pathway pseudopilin PulG